MISLILNWIHRWQLNRAVKHLHHLGLIDLSPDETQIRATPQGRTAFMYLRKFENMESK